jgi:uncharacterized membrane protein YgcG
MTTPGPLQKWTAATLLAAAAGCAGSGDWKRTPLSELQPTPLGTISDSIWQQQEENAEASDFVVHEHEWVGNSSQLNAAGMDHVKQIAARLCNVPFPVLIERSSMSVAPNTRHQFPVHNHEELDMERREFVSRALSQFGVQHADERVIVSPALTPGFQEFEAEQAYENGFSGQNGYNGGLGNGFGGGFGGSFGGGTF